MNEYMIRVTENINRFAELSVQAETAKEAEDLIRQKWIDGSLAVDMLDDGPKTLLEVSAVSEIPLVTVRSKFDGKNRVVVENVHLPDAEAEYKIAEDFIDTYLVGKTDYGPDTCQTYDIGLDVDLVLQIGCDQIENASPKFYCVASLCDEDQQTGKIDDSHAGTLFVSSTNTFFDPLFVGHCIDDVIRAFCDED